VIKVVFFHRKRALGNYSIENLFKQLSYAFPKEIVWKNKELSFYSKGFFKRLLIGIEAMFNQRDVNHITGDVNFIAIFLRKKRTILTIHDIGYMNHPNPIARFLLVWFWIRIPAHCSSIITTVSTATKTELLKYVSIDPSSIKVIHNAFSPLFESYPKSFNSKRPRILQIGTKHNKNLIRLIQALEGINCELDLVGALNDEILKELKARGVDYITSANISDEEMVKKYQQADVVSFVSTYEGFGIPILEANSIGRVVVTSNILSMPEVAGDAAHLVDPFEVTSIREGFFRVVNDDEYRAKLIANGFNNIERFKVDEIAKQYCELYRTLAESNSVLAN